MSRRLKSESGSLEQFLRFLSSELEIKCGDHALAVSPDVGSMSLWPDLQVPTLMAASDGNKSQRAELSTSRVDPEESTNAMSTAHSRQFLTCTPLQRTTTNADSFRLGNATIRDKAAMGAGSSQPPSVAKLKS
jgi:hypothetical protein